MLKVKKSLFDEIKLYCKSNGIDDVELFCNRILEKGFNVEKYGATPAFIDTVKKVENKVEPIDGEEKNIISLPEVSKPTKKINRENYKKANLNDDYKVYDEI